MTKIKTIKTIVERPKLKYFLYNATDNQLKRFEN